MSINQNQKILTGFAGILIYLISLKTYDLADNLVGYLFLGKIIEESFLWPLYLIIGILSAGVFVVQFNKITSRKLLKISTLILLFLVLVLLSFAVAFSNKLLAEFLAGIEKDVDVEKVNYFFTYSVSSAIRVYYPVLVFLYYLWKIHKDNRLKTSTD